MALTSGPAFFPGHDHLRSVPRASGRPEDSGNVSAPVADQARGAFADIDLSVIQRTFAPVLTAPESAIEYLFAQLFVRSPELRSLFPLSMTSVRAEADASISRLFGSIGSLAEHRDLLGEMARLVRRHGIGRDHYPLFADALVATLEQLNGVAWTPQAERAWRELTGHLGAIMCAAAEADARRQPAWWVGEIVQHELRTPTIAMITIRPDQPLRYRPGQFVGAQVDRWPRVWRDYSVANAPRENGLLDLHVRAVPGGMVSNFLVSHSGPGDTVILSAARGGMRVDPDDQRDLVCVAGGTGLAPLKALIESVIGASGHGRRRRISLYLAARREEDFYDSRDLDALALAYPALTVTRVLDGAGDATPGAAITGAVAVRHPSFRDTDVYLAGPEAMIGSLRRALADRVPASRVHYDSFGPLAAANSD